MRASFQAETTDQGRAPSPKAVTSDVVDVRRVPLNALSGADDGRALRRVVAPAGSARVPVAAFNASL